MDSETKLQTYQIIVIHDTKHVKIDKDGNNRRNRKKLYYSENQSKITLANSFN